MKNGKFFWIRTPAPRKVQSLKKPYYQYIRPDRGKDCPHQTLSSQKHALVFASRCQDIRVHDEYFISVHMGKEYTDTHWLQIGRGQGIARGRTEVLLHLLQQSFLENNEMIHEAIFIQVGMYDMYMKSLQSANRKSINFKVIFEKEVLSGK